MPWPDNDNSNIRGPIDQQWVSLTEPHEVDAFVRSYIATRRYTDVAASTAIVKRDVLAYPGRRPVKRTDLEAHLDKVYADRKAKA